MSYGGLLNATCKVVHQTSTGASTTGYPTHTASQFRNERCAVQPGASSALIANDKRSATMVWTGYFLATAKVRVGDQLEVLTGPSNLVGREFRVIGLAMDAAGRGHHIEAPLEEVRP